jgi:VCBS repeat-containing protein
MFAKASWLSVLARQRSLVVSEVAGRVTSVAQAGDEVDILTGSDRADRIWMGLGDNLVRPGAGDDAIYGGTGVDTVVFQGRAEDFSWRYHDDGNLVVTDRNLDDGDEGRDVLSRIEILRFDDVEIDLRSNNAPLVLSTDQVTQQDRAFDFNVRAFDFDRGRLAIEDVSVTGPGKFKALSDIHHFMKNMGIGADITMRFDPAGAYDHLGLGESVVETASIRLADRQGGTTTRTMEILIEGKNDAPEITDILYDARTVGEGALTSATGQVIAFDVDLNDIVRFDIVGGGVGMYGNLSIDDEGHWTYTLDLEAPATQFLSLGSVGEEAFEVRVSDGNGGVDEAYVLINVEAAALVSDPTDDPATALLLTMEDLVSDGYYHTVPGDYGGFLWNESAFGLDVSDPWHASKDSGYANAPTSGTKVMFNSHGRSLEFSRADSFDFESAQMTSAWRTNLSVTITGYEDGVLKGSQTQWLSPEHSTRIDFDDDIFGSVDRVVILGSGGTPYGSGGEGPQVIIDDMAFFV